MSYINYTSIKKRGGGREAILSHSLPKVHCIYSMLFRAYKSLIVDKGLGYE